MQRFTVSNLSGYLVTHGRTFREPKEDILFFNWSCDTVEFIFSGTHLNVSFRAGCGWELEGPPSDPDVPKRATWPWVAVFLDDNPAPVRKFEVASPNETWLLHHSPEPQTHRIRLVKLTENSKTFLGITGFSAEGEFFPVEQMPTKRLEIVGDSITCGYGNLVKDPNRHFFSADEDAWQAYGPLAARRLGWDCSCVSISGITAVRHAGWMGDYAMNELYAYTDRVYQEKLGLAPEPWDFTKAPNDVVVLNLGTNDCFGILFCPEASELERFTGAYGCIRLNVADSRAIATTTDLEGLTQVAVPVTMEFFSAEDAPMFLIPSYAARYVSSVLDAKEALTVGITDHELIFSAHGLLVSCPACKAEFLDPSMILRRLKPCYSALVEREAFCNALHSLTVSAKDPRATVDLGLTDDSLTLKCADLFSRTSTNIAATAARPTPHVFYYREDILEKAVQTLQGSIIRIGIDQDGALLLRTKEQFYVQMPRTRAFIPSAADVKKPTQTKRTGAKKKAA